MPIFILGQIVGFLALVVSLFVYQFNNRINILLLLAFAAFLWAGSFFLIGAYTGAILNFIGALRCLAFIPAKSSQSSIKIFFLFAFVSITATYFTWAGPISLLALLGTLASALSTAQLKTKKLRRAGLIAPPLWFSYNFLTMSYAGMLVEICVIASNLVGQYRFDFKRKRTAL